MKYIIGFYFIIFSLSFAINPTDSGYFPPGFWEEMERQDIGMEYGDPGWKKKISDWKNNSNRDAQLEFNIPVLLGKYSDTEITYFDEIDFQNLLFDNNPTGSMKEYYEEISYGNFLVDGNSDGWYQSRYSIAQAKINTRQFIADIAQLADPDFDYSLYDNDGPDNVPNSGDDDGYVDGIMVVYAGCGAEWGSGNDNLWPHMSTLGDYEYTTNDMAEDGSSIIINTYAVSPELAGGGDCDTDIIRPMGVYAHEFGHILGLPDLYDRDDESGEQSEGLGEWCLMASGSWLGWGGDKPAHMSAWCKLEMGWIDPVILSTNYNDLEIPQIETNPYVLKIWEDDYYWNRYFLVENRQKEGFDSDLNGSGIIIYHIDENQRYGSHSFSSGPVNNDETHKFIDIEEADGFSDLDNQINRGDDGDSFPGSSNNIAFDDNSNPNSSRYDGTETGISVTNISSSYEIMTADISIRQQYGYTIAYDELGINSSFGYSNPQNTWGGVLFTSPGSGLLTAVDVGIYWGSEYHNFEVLVYDSFDGASPGTLLESIPSDADESKWYSVPIDSIEVTDGEDFFIALKINASFAIPIDAFGEKSNRSYYSENGSEYYNSISNYGDINIRAKITTCTKTEMDVCGVCGGSGIPDGDCDCDGNEDLGCGCGEAGLSGCDNACNSTAVEDCAGVCGGDSVLSGCDDTCNSTAVEDCAGVCGGDSVLSGCDNVCGSTAVVDECGECAGYNSTCTGCMNNAACNYNDCNGDEVLDDPCTIEDNELCSYPEAVYLKCDGSCINDSNEDGVCDELSLFGGAIPEEYNIHSIYPNPFNPVTNIIYGLPEYSRVHIIIYDISGRPVITLVNEYQTPGYYSTVWNADSYPSGIYFVNIIAGDFMNTQKLMLIK